MPESKRNPKWIAQNWILSTGAKATVEAVAQHEEYVSQKEVNWVYNMEKLFIKNMVCDRCIMVVQNELSKLNIPATEVRLGEVSLESKLSDCQKYALSAALTTLGFELLDDRRRQLVEQIKTAIIELVHHQDNEQHRNLSELLSQRIGHDYNSLSHLFSEVEGTTIEKYVIAQRIEKVKELLTYEQLTLNEIADKLHYSSAAYLSNQFKKVTGDSPSQFKMMRSERRSPLDKVK